jgi:hypothetical protein
MRYVHGTKIGYEWAAWTSQTGPLRRGRTTPQTPKPKMRRRKKGYLAI